MRKGARARRPSIQAMAGSIMESARATVSQASRSSMVAASATAADHGDGIGAERALHPGPARRQRSAAQRARPPRSSASPAQESETSKWAMRQ